MNTFIRNGIGCCLAILALFIFQISNNTAGDETPQPPLLKIENKTASAVAWSPDGKILAVGDSEGVKLYTENFELIKQFEQPSQQMKLLAWSPEGHYLAAYGANDIDRDPPVNWKYNPVYIWDTETGEAVTIFDQQANFIAGLAWNADGTKIATGSWDRTIMIWNPLSGEVLRVIDSPEIAGYSNDIFSLSWAPSGRMTANIGLAAVFIWENENDEQPREVVDVVGQQPPDPVTSIWSPDERYIDIGIGLYDVDRDTETRFRNCPDTSSGDWHPTSRLIAIYTRSDVSICDPISDVVLTTLDAHISDQEVLFGYDNSVDWHPDGKRLAGAAGDGFVRIWDVSPIVDGILKDKPPQK